MVYHSVYINNMEFAREIAFLTRPLADHECECCKNQSSFDYNGIVELESPSGGAFVGVKCNQCNHVMYTGDGDFMTYFQYNEEDDQFEHVPM